MRLRNTVLTVCLFSLIGVEAQDWGIGIRLGDPSGITIKKYMGNKAFELNVGRTHMFYGKGYYNNRFNSWYDDNKFGYKAFQYLGYKASVPIGVQLHFLIHKGISEVLEEDVSGLTWYYGIGGQFRSQNYTYDYRYKIEGSPDWFYSTGERVKDIDIGVDGIIGLEYIFEDAPVAIFIDAVLFMEIVDDPFLFWGQGGFGVRYNF